MNMEPSRADILAAVKRLEQKVDALIAALAEDGDEEPSRTLDGAFVPGERDTSRGLG